MLSQDCAGCHRLRGTGIPQRNRMQSSCQARAALLAQRNRSTLVKTTKLLGTNQPHVTTGTNDPRHMLLPVTSGSSPRQNHSLPALHYMQSRQCCVSLETAANPFAFSVLYPCCLQKHQAGSGSLRVAENSCSHWQAWHVSGIRTINKLCSGRDIPSRRDPSRVKLSLAMICNALKWTLADLQTDLKAAGAPGELCGLHVGYHDDECVWSSRAISVEARCPPACRVETN